MVGVATDMPETPDDILRALADPERLAIAGHLARSNATAGDLAETIRVPRSPGCVST
jgi:DNA-binding transcriptional ArsR family regulator